jgi:hypothetical protein
LKQVKYSTVLPLERDALKGVPYRVNRKPSPRRR